MGTNNSSKLRPGSKKSCQSKYSPETRVQFVFQCLKPKGISGTSKAWGIPGMFYYNWLREMIAGAKIHFDASYATSNHALLKAFRKDLVKYHIIRNKKLAAENDRLKSHIALLKPIKGWRRYSDSQKISLIEAIKKFPYSQAIAERILDVSKSSYALWCREIKEIKKVKKAKKVYRKYEQKVYIDAVFKLLHSPPSSHGINRTSWNLIELRDCLKKSGIIISETYIAKILKNAGYKSRLAMRVLTSRDLLYDEKLKNIQGILKKLKPDELFFSIDEFGPFAVKDINGMKLSLKSENRIVQQIQKSKGCVTLMGALELSTNQMSCVFGWKPETSLTLSLVNALRTKYRNYKQIYLMWDHAKYHSSKVLLKQIDTLNCEPSGPRLVRVELPAGAQFLNVIESVFGGMYRAVIQNSNYATRELCIKAMIRHVEERNIYYKKNPKKAGKKIWGNEQTLPVFKATNNCVERNFTARSRPHYKRIKSLHA
ncbi:transposase [Aurantibacillus circumpalustris]|uniref:transposase n=1 Tax=Aurantibacillus circumpalustris TaxID=3036359 RepID=UPI00295C09F9|nr:transposase [Aurantibacillus circumpalustris]